MAVAEEEKEAQSAAVATSPQIARATRAKAAVSKTVPGKPSDKIAASHTMLLMLNLFCI